jgi:ferredoxin-NAD(P)+ reductase (naphthalene dioxygenase ferredoxin-specific)
MTSDQPPIDAEIVRLRHGRADVAILTLKPLQPFSWRAGQYVQLGAPGFAPRFYSIANAPAGPDLLPEIHVRKAGNEGLSAWLVEQARPGAILSLAGPFGDLSIEAHDERPVLLIAGGLGIAPLKSLVERALQRTGGHEVVLVWGTNHEMDQYLRDYFHDLAVSDPRFRFISVTGQPVSHAIRSLFDDFSTYAIFLAGPPDMIVATKSLLETLEIEAERMNHDPLPPGYRLVKEDGP